MGASFTEACCNSPLYVDKTQTRAHTDTDTHTDTQIHTHRHPDTQIHTHTQTHRYTHIHTPNFLVKLFLVLNPLLNIVSYKWKGMGSYESSA